MHYIPYTNKTIKNIPQFSGLPVDKQHELEVLCHIFHFKTNNYVVDELIDWSNWENDPIFILNFPRMEMIDEYDFNLLSQLIKRNSNDEMVQNYAESIKLKLLPRSQSVPHQPINMIKSFVPEGISGLYQQFPTIVSAFTVGAKECFAYCTYCFRWMTFAYDGISFNYSDPQTPIDYLQSHPEISDILFTGGDAMQMSAKELERFVSPLMGIETVQTIRLGTRALTWWPYRFVTDDDADELLSFLEFIISKGKHVALMAHISHPRELETNIVQLAIRKIRSTGAVIRTQCPVVKRLNDSKEVWIELIRKEIQLGLIPYYMFVESGKLPGPAFKIPLASALKIFQNSQKELSGIAKTLQGPVLTNGPYKILIDGVTELNDEKVFVLKILQSTDSDLRGKIFFAKYDETANDFHQLDLIHKENEFSLT